jgi:tetratricopeptide (TPR) repeat protein
MWRHKHAIAAAVFLVSAGTSSAEPVSRNAPATGSVIARRSGEEVRFIEVSSWRSVDVHQDLLAGDVLRTNALGNLAVLFNDNTQVRLGRNTVMVVKEIGQGADSRVTLESGSIWARAERGGEGVVVETPAAAAAIRGTDWTMTVDGDRTSLTVLEGRIDLYNEYGSVSVERGEAASARIGQAPTKTIIVDPDDRAQMLYYLSLRNSFNSLPVSALSSADMRRERARIAAIPEAARTAENWLSLAEISLTYDGRAAAIEIAAKARARRLSAAQLARLDLVDAMVAASEKRYSDANLLFNRALPRLSGSRKVIAAYGGYFARSLADPSRNEQPPSAASGGPYGAIAQALTAGFMQDIPAAIAIIRKAEQRYPNDPTLPAVRAQLAILVDDREQVNEAIERSLTLDPDDPTALEARGLYRAEIESDLEGSLADLTRASELAPGSTTIWNQLGLVLGMRGASRESEAALKKSIELDPEDPASRANLAIHYLEQDRLAEAKREIDLILKDDPGFDMGLVARGLYHLKEGDTEQAIQDLLAASTANPAYAGGLLLLAAAYYENGDHDPAAQALENAERLDPNEPATAQASTAIAIYENDSDRAIRSAQEALKRTRAQGGDFAALSVSREQGSTLNQAYRIQGLDAWGRYYSDVVFDPFSPSALVDQAVSGSADPFINTGTYGETSVADPVVNDQAFGSLLQALLLDSRMLVSPSRSPGLVQRPFVEASIAGGGVGGDSDGWTGTADLSGYVASPFPISFYGQIAARDTDEQREGRSPGAPIDNVSFDLEDKMVAGVGYITANPTPNDRLVAFANVQDTEENLLNYSLVPFPAVPFVPGIDIVGVGYDRTLEDKTGSYGLAWSHTFGYRNVVSGGVFASGFNRNSSETGSFLLTDGVDFALISSTEQVDTDQTSLMGAINHTIGIDDVTLRYGFEGGTFDQDRTTTSTLGALPPVTVADSFELIAGRGYIDGIYEFSPTLKAEGALFTTFYEGNAFNEVYVEPRVGVAWSPFEGHWLRAGYLEESSALNAVTLAPIGIVGLQSNHVPLDVGGTSRTFAARWDAEWSGYVFTALDYQHQVLDDLAIPEPLSLTEIDVEKGRIDRIGATVNLWLTHGFGLFGGYAYTDSKNESDGFGGPIPYVAESAARLGVTYVSPSEVKANLSATYVGSRTGNLLGTEMDGYWTVDFSASYEAFDKRLAFEFAAYNLLDEEFEVAPNVPGWGRVFTGSLKVRF